MIFVLPKSPLLFLKLVYDFSFKLLKVFSKIKAKILSRFFSIVQFSNVDMNLVLKGFEELLKTSEKILPKIFLEDFLESLADIY